MGQEGAGARTYFCILNNNNLRPTPKEPSHLHPCSLSTSLEYMFFFLFIFERQGERESGGGAERERIPSRLRTVCAEPDAGLALTNCEIATRAEIKEPDT